MMFLQVFVTIAALLSPSFAYGHLRFNNKLADYEKEGVAEGITKFGVHLHKLFMSHYYEGGENILFSPISVYYSLALAHYGAAGTTQDELATVLGIPKEREAYFQWHQALGDLARRLHESSYANISMYNELFVQSGYHVKDDYIQQMHKLYDSKMLYVDFSSQGATDYINKWFSAATYGRIPQFYDQPLSYDIKLVLANVLSFGGQWDHYFPTEDTKTEYFRGEDGQEVEISMMHTTDYVPYYNDASDKYEVVGIPYQNKEYYMYLILPYESESLKHFSEIFTYEHINRIVRDSVVSKVDIKLPIMRLRTSNRMKESLGQMGISYLFESADLSNMLTESQLKVSEIWHRVDIDVNEKGATFSAGTTQEYKVYSEHVSEQDAEQFYVQRPYMFFIYHPETHTVLFYGSINKLSNY